MPSIRELRDRKQRERFIGRERETASFRRLLEAAEPEHAVLQIWGVGGIGKTTLMQTYRRVAEELGCGVALVDMQLHFGVVEILRTIREQLGKEERAPFAEFDRALDLYNDVRSKLHDAVGSLTSGVVSGIREGVPLGIGALAVDAIGEEKVKAWLYRHLPRANADLYLDGDSALTAKLVAGLNQILESRRLVMLFDTYEQSSELQDEWLRSTLLESELSATSLVVLAGRDPLSSAWQSWREVTLSLELRPFSEDEARLFLERRGIAAEEEVEVALRATERLPWALALLVDARGGGSLAGGENLHAIGESLVERFLSQLQDRPDLRELVEACAVVRAFDHDVVRALARQDGVAAAMDRLRGYSFVITRAEGRWSLNQTVREFLDRSLRRRSPERWEELNRRALEVYQGRANRAPRYTREWSWLSLESLYHRLRLDERDGMTLFAALFEEAKHLYRHDFCSELLNNVEDVELSAESRHWLAYYRDVMVSERSGLPWLALHDTDEELYRRRDLPPSLRARVTASLGRYCYQTTGEVERAIALLEESLALRLELRDEKGEAMVLSHLAVAHAMRGELEKARAEGRRAVDCSERLALPLRSGWGHASLGVVESLAGDQVAALRELEAGLRVFEAHGQEYEAGVVRYQIGRVLAQRGDLDGALRELEAHLAAMQKFEKPALEARALVEIAGILLRRGDEGRLPAAVANAEALVQSQGNDLQRARLRVIQARIVLRRSDADRDAAEPPCWATVAGLLADALLSAAAIPRAALDPTAAEIAAIIEELRPARRELAAHLLEEIQGRIGALRAEGKLPEAELPVLSRYGLA